MFLRQEFNLIDMRDYAALHPELFAYAKEQMAQPGKQFLLIGDMDHLDPVEEQFLKSPAIPALCQYADIPHVALEEVREIMAPQQLESYRDKVEGCETWDELEEVNEELWRDLWEKMRAYAENYEIALSKYVRDLNEGVKKVKDQIADGKMSAEDGQKKIREANDYLASNIRQHSEPRLTNLILNGLRVTAADSFQWLPKQVPSVEERKFLGDREVADYIKQQAGAEKTAVIYGAAHLLYDGALSARLGRENAVHIDIYSSRASYKRRLAEEWNMHADFLPDRIYLLHEKVLEKPDPALYRHAENRLDDKEQQWKDDIVSRFGPDADPAKKQAALAEIVKLPEIDPDYFNYVPPKKPDGPA